MFCPSCGCPKWEVLFGGKCKWCCCRCKKGIICVCAFTNKITKNSRPIFNPFKALLLSYKWEQENL